MNKKFSLKLCNSLKLCATKSILPILVVFTLTFTMLSGFLYAQNKILKKQISSQQIPTVTTKTGNNDPLNFTLSKIKDKGSISGIKTINTDSWTLFSDKVTESRSFSFSFKYPGGLYVVPNVRNENNSLYFFENEDAYKEYLACRSENIDYGGKLVSKDWEGGCYLDNNFLFMVQIDYGWGLQNFSNKIEDLVRYTGWDEETTWIMPNESKFLGRKQLLSTFYAEGKKNITNDWYEIELDYVNSNTEKVERLTGMSIYQLFTHILTTLQIEYLD